ncbi:RING-H2 finger protein ATL65 [Impatiens glandulifera]|uniref:RING-H2 finger protein ATL65 n=1 Tax=Impatiens glandulifera TaxID=253017 RepID=UPI001FB102CB|nr:RING-H2 finger protein ATL65 [Impatiens glandulifera]
MTTAPSPSPENHSHSIKLLSPSPSPSTAFLSSNSSPQTPSKLPIDFSPPLVAMVVVIAAAFVIVTYSRLISSYLIRVHRRWRRWRRRRRLFRSYVPSSAGDIESPPYNGSSFDLSDAFPYGLEESVIKTIPLSVYTRKSNLHDCAVCLLEFEENDYVRTLPVCYHAFHVDCIDVWLRSHANCPLCRALIFRPPSPFVPLMAARIRPSFDEVMMIESAILEPLEELPNQSEEITEELPNQSEDRFNGRDILLKRSYSFGFERNLGSERLTMDPSTSTASPWRYRRTSGGFWSKRTSPFTSLTKPRVFSFRYYRGMKSPFVRRRSGGFFPVSESSARYGGGGSSRRSKSMASPMFMRSSGGNLFFSSSRLRTGDPEALLSPERYNGRR